MVGKVERRRLRIMEILVNCDKNVNAVLNLFQVFGTVELPDKPIMLPPFVEATHCLGYHLTRKGRAVADRVVSVLGYACPDITYSPSLYPITAALLHFMPGEYIFMKIEQTMYNYNKLCYNFRFSRVWEFIRKLHNSKWNFQIGTG